MMHRKIFAAPNRPGEAWTLCDLVVPEIDSTRDEAFVTCLDCRDVMAGATPSADPAVREP